jgi:TorA maturation chaperone TorD
MKKENELEGIKSLLEIRVFAYDLLRRTFLDEPSREFLFNLVEKGLIEAFPFIWEDGNIQEGVRQVSDFFKKYDSNNEDMYIDLRLDYTRLFIGPYELPAPPWESAYLSQEHLLFQKQTLEVRQAYFKYGLLPKHFKQEADDHLGLELDFMFQLSNRSLKILETEDFRRLAEIVQDQKDFLQEHLLKWVPDFSINVIENSQYGFYQGMARILKGYLVLDLQALEELEDMEIVGSLN